MIPEWSGPRVMEARAIMARLLPQPCGQCGKTVEPSHKWVIGHTIPRWEAPELTWDVTNWRHEHAKCSESSGQAEVQRKAYAAGMRDARARDAQENVHAREESARIFSESDIKQPPPFFAYIDEASKTPFPEFDAESIRNVPWLADLFPLPEDASWPTAMSPVHPRATGTYGVEAEEWCRKTLGIELRWWQRLAMRRQLEHDENGELVWQNVIESTPRRAGKSVRLRAMALWRLAHPEIFGEPQLVLHTGKDLPIVLEIHQKAWTWAETVAQWKVRRMTGKEELVTPDGDRWIVRSVHAVYGYDVTLGMVDEAWDVDARTVDDGLEPALLERKQPQLLLTSTAHRRATSLMKRRLLATMSNLDSDTDTLLLLWCALPDDDPTSEEAWRRASPHWTAQRAQMIAGKLERALAGEADPEADDLDPLEAFKSQYLNMWQLTAPRQMPGKPIVTSTAWDELATDRPDGVPLVSACESWFAAGMSVVHVYKTGDKLVASAVPCADTQAAAAELRRGGAATVLVGKSIAGDAAFTGLPITPRGSTSKHAVESVKRFIDEGGLSHDGSEELSRQINELRTVPATEGIRIRSNGRLDAVKGLSWCVEAIRTGVEEPAIF